MGTVFTNGLGDQGSIPGQVIPKTQKIVIDASLLNTQHYKVWIKGKEGFFLFFIVYPWSKNYKK